MKAGNAYRVLHQRSSRTPSLVDPTRYDSIEVVEVASGEVVLFWDLPAPEARRRLRAVREDLARLPAGEFLARWSAIDQ